MKTTLQDYLTLASSVKTHCADAYNLRRQIQDKVPRLENAWRNVEPATFRRQFEYAWDKPQDTAKIVETRNNNLLTFLGQLLIIRTLDAELSATHLCLSQKINEADERLKAIESRAIKHEEDLRALLKMVIIDARAGYLAAPDTQELLRNCEPHFAEAYAFSKMTFLALATGCKHRQPSTAHGLDVKHSLDYLYPKSKSSLEIALIALSPQVVSILPACAALVTACQKLDKCAHSLESAQYEHEQIFRYMLGEKTHAEDLLAAASDPQRRTRRTDSGSFERVDIVEHQNRKRVRQLSARQHLFITVAQAEEARSAVRDAFMKAVTETESLLLWLDQVSKRTSSKASTDLIVEENGTVQADVQRSYQTMLETLPRHEMQKFSTASAEAIALCLSTDRKLRRHGILHRSAFDLSQEDLTDGAVWQALEDEFNAKRR